MKQFGLIKQLLIGIALLSTLGALHASSQSTFTLIPTTHTTLNIPSDGAAVVQYRVTNQTKITRTLTIVPMTGITQLTGFGNECATPFTLASKQSCLLTLQLDGSQLPNQTIKGPVVCKTKGVGNNNPDSILCSQPSQINSLNIKRLGFERAALSVSPASLSLVACGLSQYFTVINQSSTVTASNIVANLTGTALIGNVTQNASNCSSVLPGQSCALTFTPQCIGSVTLVSFPIQGDNTQPVGASMEVVLPTQAMITVTGSPLILQGTTGTPVPGFLTVTNNSPILTANDIAATLTDPLIAAGVTQDASACTSVAHGASCQLMFTPGSQDVSVQSVLVMGANTSQTTASIDVNAPPNAPIAITAGTPLTLQASGSAGTMTIQNNSPTERALNIVANFTGTNLSGHVTSTTCASVNPAASCQMSFTPGSAGVTSTDFLIEGTNTTAATGNITIIPNRVPGAPTNVVASAGIQSASIAFTAPTDPGSSPITGYTVTQTPGGIQTNGNVSPIMFYNLTNGTPYTFTVHATNSVGSGPESSPSNAVTPTNSVSCVGVGISACSNIHDSVTCAGYYYFAGSSGQVSNQCRWNGNGCTNSGVTCIVYPIPTCVGSSTLNCTTLSFSQCVTPTYYIFGSSGSLSNQCQSRFSPNRCQTNTSSVCLVP